MASARPPKKVLLSHLLKVWSPHLQISFYSQWIGCQQSCFAYHSKCLRFAQVLATHMRSFFLPRCSSRVSIFTRHWHMPGPWKPTWVAQQLASKVCGGFEFWKQFGVRRMGSDLGNPPKNRREEFFEMVEDTSEIYQWDFDPSLATWRGFGLQDMVQKLVCTLPTGRFLRSLQHFNQVMDRNGKLGLIQRFLRSWLDHWSTSCPGSWRMVFIVASWFWLMVRFGIPTMSFQWQRPSARSGGRGMGTMGSVEEFLILMVSAQYKVSRQEMTWNGEPAISHIMSRHFDITGLFSKCQ